MTQPQPTAALSDAGTVVEDNQAIREAMTRMLGIDRRRGLTIVEMPSVLRELLAEYGLEIRRRLARAESAPEVTLDEHQAELIVDIVTRYREEVDAAGLCPDLTDILATMHMQLAALADADGQGTGASK